MCGRAAWNFGSITGSGQIGENRGFLELVHVPFGFRRKSCPVHSPRVEAAGELADKPGSRGCVTDLAGAGNHPSARPVAVCGASPGGCQEAVKHILIPCKGMAMTALVIRWRTESP